MALGKSTGPKAIYLQVSAKHGEMTRWLSEEKREEKVDYVTGQVTSLEVREHKWQDESISYDLYVGLKDPSSGERYYLQMGVESRMASRLVGQLNAMDLSKEHYFRPYLIKEGDKIGEQVATMTSALFSVKPIISGDGEKLNLGEGVKPFYGEQYGSELPKAEPVVNPKTQTQIVQNGKPLFDSTERKNLTATLIGEIQAKLKGDAQQQGQSSTEDEGIDANEATQAATRMRNG